MKRIREFIVKYSPDQPRDPAGVPTGGRWTADDSVVSYYNTPDKTEVLSNYREIIRAEKVSRVPEAAEVARWLENPELRRKFYQDTSLVYACDQDVVASVLKSGKVVTGFEPEAKWKDFHRGVRTSAENLYFGTHVEETANRPIYTFLVNKGNHKQGGTYFGADKIVLKDAVKDRATVTGWDSLAPTMGDCHGMFPSRVKSIRVESLKDEQIRALTGLVRSGKASHRDILDTAYSIASGGVGQNYAEAQVHGGVSVKDIDHVVVNPSYGISKEMYLAAKANKIPVKVRDVFGDVGSFNDQGRGVGSPYSIEKFVWSKRFDDTKATQDRYYNAVRAVNKRAKNGTLGGKLTAFQIESRLMQVSGVGGWCTVFGHEIQAAREFVDKP
jgi:hypothetical protein